MDAGWTVGGRWVDGGWTVGGRWVDGGWTVGGRWVDGGWTVGGRWVDAGWTVGGRWVDAGWTVTRKTVTEGGRDGHGRWMGWSRKVDGMVTEGGRKAVKIERFTVINSKTVVKYFKNIVVNILSIYLVLNRSIQNRIDLELMFCLLS